MSQATDGDSFALTTSPAAYLPRPDTERALTELEEWALNGATSSTWLAGPPGLGKTLLLKVLADRLSGHKLCIYVAYPVLPPEAFAAWVLDAVGKLAGDAPQERIAEFAEQRAEQGGLLLLIDDAMLMPPATRSALEGWYGESNGALRSVLAASGSPSLTDAGGSSGDSCVTLDEPLSLEESRELLTAAMERSRLGAEARALFDPATLEEIHECAGGVPTRLLIEAGQVLFARREELAPGTSAPLLEWGGSANAAPEPPLETPVRPAAEPVQEPLALPFAAPQPAAPAAPGEPAAMSELAEPPDPAPLTDLLHESNPVPGGTRDRGRPPRARSQQRGILAKSAGYAGAFGGGVLATLIAIQLLGGDPDSDLSSDLEPGGAPKPTITAPAATLVRVREESIVQIGPGSIEFEREVAPVSAAPPTAPVARPTAAVAPTRAATASGNRTVTEGVIRKGEWLAASFREHDIPMPILTLIGREVGDVFDFTHSRPGHRYTVTRDGAGELVAFRYVIGPGDELHVRRTGEDYTVARSVAAAR